MKPLQLDLNASKLPMGVELQNWVKATCDHILHLINLHISLKEPITYRLQVDWSSNSFGYLLYAGAPERGVLVGLNSNRARANASSSFLALCWAVEDIRRQLAGISLVVWTDSESSYLRIEKNRVAKNKLVDVRVSRLLVWC